MLGLAGATQVAAGREYSCALLSETHAACWGRNDDDQLGALVCLIALINLYNRLNVITRQPAGDYTPGQWG